MAEGRSIWIQSASPMATKVEKLLLKGQGLEKKGKRDKALEIYRDACKQAPYDPEVWTVRADTAFALGMTGEAAEALFHVADLYARGGMPLDALRLARRVLDFHLANQSLEERGAALVAVENSIDMGTADGRLVANVLASFAEYEAAAISARVAAAVRASSRRSPRRSAARSTNQRSTSTPSRTSCVRCGPQGSM